MVTCVFSAFVIPLLKLRSEGSLPDSIISSPISFPILMCNLADLRSFELSLAQ
jgi:hypothetical protein